MIQISQRCVFSAGETIDGTYRVERTLGEGAFGTVYSVYGPDGNRYALKLLKLWEVPPEIREPLIQRFDMEFETGRIQSDHLVHSLSHGIVGGNPYIVMEFCPGGDLAHVTPQSDLEYSRVACHVLYGLKALHACGKVHRDLKPENVLVKANGNYALTDFGISGDRNKRMTERNIVGRPKQIFGTYAYIPPEQVNPLKDATVLPTTDIFSFGVMIYQLLTGDLPFGQLEAQKDLVTYLRNGREGKWNVQALQTSPQKARWIDLIMGCLHPDYKQRIQNVDTVLKFVPDSDKISTMSGSTVNENNRNAGNIGSGVGGVQDFQRNAINGILLRIMQGDEYGRVYRLNDLLHEDNSILLMGRRDYNVPNDIDLREDNSSYISRRHCTLELVAGIDKWIIRDGQWDKNGTRGWRRSTNGTFVNSSEVDDNGLMFAPGDIISIGDTKLRVEGY